MTDRHYTFPIITQTSSGGDDPGKLSTNTILVSPGRLAPWWVRWYRAIGRITARGNGRGRIACLRVVIEGVEGEGL